MEEGSADSKNIEKFNKVYRGNYFNPNDSSFLEITSDKVIRTFIVRFQVSKHDIDTIYQLENCTDSERMNKLSQKGISGRIECDTIIGTYEEKDTSFIISEKNVLRFYKGSYFLNVKKEKGRWRVRRLDLNKKTLTISSISPYDSLFHTVPIAELPE